MRLHRTLAAAAVLLVGPMLVAGPAQATPATENKGWNPVLLSSEPLYDGSAVRLRYTEGVTVVASAGAQVTFTGSGAAATLPDGRRVYDRAVQVADPQGVTSSSNAKQAAASTLTRSLPGSAQQRPRRRHNGKRGISSPSPQ